MDPKGMCQKEDPTRKCLSSGECRACKLIGTKYEGCDITTGLPICDADRNTTEVDFMDYTNITYNAQCAACTMKGNSTCAH